MEATDGGTPSLSDVATASINVTDINDNAPEFLNGPYHATVPEMSILGMYASIFTELLRIVFKIAFGIRDSV